MCVYISVCACVCVCWSTCSYAWFIRVVYACSVSVLLYSNMCEAARPVVSLCNPMSGRISAMGNKCMSATGSMDASPYPNPPPCVSLQICDVYGLGHLSHLRVLNLAGNEITVVSGLFELKSLTELNLRRNRVRQVVSACMSVCMNGWVEEGMVSKGLDSVTPY